MEEHLVVVKMEQEDIKRLNDIAKSERKIENSAKKNKEVIETLINKYRNQATDGTKVHKGG